MTFAAVTERSAANSPPPRPLPTNDEVWITGLGMLDSRQQLDAARVARTIPPAFNQAPLVSLGWDRNDADEAEHIPSRPDRRAMGHQFSSGVCAAVMALKSAGLQEDLIDVGVYVATRLAERDETLDRSLHEAGEPGETLNRAIIAGLRPTLFLAQLPNLLAGNLAIITGLRGVSRTFIGEEMAGVNALWTATRDIISGRSDVALVGGALNASREGLLRWMHASGAAAVPDYAPVKIDPTRGVVMGSVAAFVVLEDAERATGRSRAPIATVQSLARLRATNDTVLDDLSAVHAAAKAAAPPLPMWIITNTHGSARSDEELKLWRRLCGPDAVVVLTADLVGSALEADAAAALYIAARLLSEPGYVATLSPDAIVGQPSVEPGSILVLSSGLESGLGAMLVRRPS